MGVNDDQLDELVRVVRSGASYRTADAALVRNIGARALARTHNLKAAVKATRGKLHQVAGAYLDRRDYVAWLHELAAAAQSGCRDILLATCRTIMQRHASSRERLPILETFYRTTLGHLPPIHTVLDVACGLNPLAIPWMPLAADVVYDACDIYQDLVDFVNQALPILGVRGHAQIRDVTQDYPTSHVTLALILKTLPCLEQIDKSASLHLLEALDADYMLVSFPVHSLGGRRKGMPASYEGRFRALAADRGWTVERFVFATELAFLVTR